MLELPELVSKWKLGIENARMRGIVQRVLRVIGRETQPSLAKRCGEHLSNASEGAPLRPDLHVDPRPHEEERTREEHEHRGDGEAQRPADVGLDVDDDGGGDHHGEGEGEVVPVEEAVDPLASRIGARIELVRAECEVAGPDAAGAYHQKAEGGEQDD